MGSCGEHHAVKSKEEAILKRATAVSGDMKERERRMVFMIATIKRRRHWKVNVMNRTAQNGRSPALHARDQQGLDLNRDYINWTAEARSLTAEKNGIARLSDLHTNNDRKWLSHDLLA